MVLKKIRKQSSDNQILLFAEQQEQNNNQYNTSLTKILNNEKKQIFQNKKLNNQLNNSNPNDQVKHQRLTIKPQSTLLSIVKKIFTLLIIIATSYQIYSLTTNRLDHSRNFVRFLNYYILQHSDLGFYWVGQYALNYPIHQYYQLGEIHQFMKRTQKIFQEFDDYVYGFVDFQQFLEKENHIYVQSKQSGKIQEYVYRVIDGFQQPFRTDNLTSIKQAILTSEQLRIQLQPFIIYPNHKWTISISITKFSQTSMFVQIHAKEYIQQFWKYHFIPFILGICLMIVLVKEYFNDRNSWLQNIPEYMLCVFLVNTFCLSLQQQNIDHQWVIILDGIQCCIAWILLLRFLQKQDDYHISFLLKQSYVLVSRLFISFSPIFIAVSLFAYIIFCRQSFNFSTFRRTFLNLFYISYYNMTYQSFVVTMRTNPISMIFFFVFVILFTICVYSGMLVSVFCSYVWNKRENKIKNDIINNLKIQCSQCEYKYKYIDCLKLINSPKKSRRSFKTSFILQIDFNTPQQRYKYKKILANKIQNLSKKMISLIQQQKKFSVKRQMKPLLKDIKQKIMQKQSQTITKLLHQVMFSEFNNNKIFYDQQHNHNLQNSPKDNRKQIKQNKKDKQKNY